MEEKVWQEMKISSKGTRKLENRVIRCNGHIKIMSKESW